MCDVDIERHRVRGSQVCVSKRLMNGDCKTAIREVDCCCMFNFRYVIQMVAFVCACIIKKAASCSSAARHSGPPEEVSRRSQPRSVINTLDSYITHQSVLFPG